jgi:hypothetical protein
MNDQNDRYIDRGSRVQTFGIDNAMDFGEGMAKQYFGRLDVLLDQVRAAQTGQVAARISKEALLDALHIDLKNISRTARSIELIEPGFAAPFRLPDSPAEIHLLNHGESVLMGLEDKASDTVAVKTAKAATRTKFISYEMPQDFVAHLRADRELIADTNRHNQSEVLEGVESTRLVGELIGQMNDVITHLDAIMYNKYTRQPEKLRAWQSASHVERAPRREKPAVAKPAVQPTA